MEVILILSVSLAITILVAAFSNRKWLKCLAIISNGILIYVTVYLSIAYGRLDERIMQSGPVYDVLVIFRQKIQSENPIVAGEIDRLLKKMDRKNFGGSNGPIMMEYISSQNQKTYETQAQP